LRARFKFVVLEVAEHFGVTKACKEFDVPHSTLTVGKSGMMKKTSPGCI
jgi:hypothetical protein